MKIFEGQCPVCHRNVRIPEMTEIHMAMYMPEDELKKEIALLKAALADAFFLIDEYGSPLLKAHATSLTTIRQALYGKDVFSE